MDESNSNILFQYVNEAVRKVLNKWSGYQLALLNQTGGDQTSEKDLWLSEILSTHLINENDILIDDLADYIDDILDTEFDLILEDGSIEPASDVLIKTTKLIMQDYEGTRDEVQLLINNLRI